MIDDEFYTWYYYFSWDAGVAELADAPDLGSGALRRGGSSPFSRTNFIAPLEVLFFLPKIRFQNWYKNHYNHNHNYICYRIFTIIYNAV